MAGKKAKRPTNASPAKAGSHGRLRAPTPRQTLAKLKHLITSGVGIALDEYMGGYQCTVYPFGKNDPTKHLHYEAQTIEEAIVLAHNDTYGK